MMVQAVSLSTSSASWRSFFATSADDHRHGRGSITVLDDAKSQHKIRSPGSMLPKEAKPMASNRSRALSALVFQKRAEARCHKKERYGREVCAVFVGLRDVGLEGGRRSRRARSARNARAWRLAA
jgi:hypothetical protein